MSFPPLQGQGYRGETLEPHGDEPLRRVSNHEARGHMR